MRGGVAVDSAGYAVDKEERGGGVRAMGAPAAGCGVRSVASSALEPFPGAGL